MNAEARRAAWIEAWRELGVDGPDDMPNDALFAELQARYSEMHRA